MNTIFTQLFGRRQRFLTMMFIAAIMLPAVLSAQSAPVLMSPADAATEISTSPTLGWSAEVGDSVYHLQISTVIGFGTTVYDDATLTSASNTITGLVNSTTYFWRVRMTRTAAIGGGTSPYSAIRSFTTWDSTPVAQPKLLPVVLGSTAGFAILSATGVTNTGVTAVKGNIGASPITGASMTGFGTATIDGIVYTTDATGPVGHVMYPSMLTTAMGDLTIAYNDAAGRTTSPIGIAGNIGGRTLYSGLYKSTGSLEITSGDLTLDAQGDPTAVWIIQIASSFNMTDGRQVFLSGGAKASNVFWQVTSLASFGSGCVMKGTVIAGTSITFVTTSTLEGRALAKTGNVTMQANTIGGSEASPLIAPVFLATASDFRVLAGTNVAVGTGSTVVGNVGGSIVTNNGTITGATHESNATVSVAQSDLTTAYNDAAARTVDSTIATELGGTTIAPGIYNSASGTFTINDTVILNGSVNDVFIFKTATTLISAVGSRVRLTGGVEWPNVFWQVGSSATIDGDFKGNILALTAITQNSDSINGRALARNSFVTVNGAYLLPVELTSFQVTSNRTSAQLHWSTATETNNYGFEVERNRKINGQLTMDNWTKAGFVHGNGTTNIQKEYTFTDNALLPGTYAYRLKQIDRDGKFEYSNIIEATISQTPLTTELMQNYPNPFNPTTKIGYTLAAATQVRLRVFTLLGTEVATLVNSRQEAGSYSVPFSAVMGSSTLTSGVYFYRLEAGSLVLTKKLMLMK